MIMAYEEILRCKGFVQPKAISFHVRRAAVNGVNQYTTALVQNRPHVPMVWLFLNFFPLQALMSRAWHEQHIQALAFTHP